MCKPCLLMGFVVVQILYGALIPERGVEVYSRCALPCARRQHVLEQIQGPKVVNFTTGDPRYAIVTRNATTYAMYCIERAGPFYLLGRTINGINEYSCQKDTRYESDDLIRVVYDTEYMPFSGRPDICEICNGEGMEVKGFADIKEEDCKIVVPKDMGCNIPWFCPVVNATTQVQCDPCEPYEKDDGLCCKTEETSSEETSSEDTSNENKDDE